MALAAAAVLGVPAGAAAADDDLPAPVIAGTPHVGETLVASNEGWSRGRPDYYWLRCAADAADECDDVATGSEYELTDDDAGFRMRVLLVVTRRDDTRWGLSDPTDVVPAGAEKPEEPVDPPPVDPPPVDPPPADPTPAPLAPAPAVPGSAGEVLGGGERRAVLLRPFPVVRVKGWLTRRGAMIRLLTVRAPRGTRITVRCRGQACPRERWTRRRSRKITHVTPFQRHLAGGTRLVVRVTRKGWIGKHTVIRVREGKAPARRDRCLFPGSRKPKRCPGGR